MPNYPLFSSDTQYAVHWLLGASHTWRTLSGEEEERATYAESAPRQGQWESPICSLLFNLLSREV